MVTTVGHQTDPQSLITNLVQLEHDALAAYDTVLERLENPQNKTEIERFRDDHLRHLEALKGFAAKHGAEAPADSGAKSMLTTGKVKLADLAGGDGAILKAMSSNETDTVDAYQNSLDNAVLPEDMRSMVEGALSDERRHKAWMDQAS